MKKNVFTEIIPYFCKNIKQIPHNNYEKNYSYFFNRFYSYEL